MNLGVFHLSLNRMRIAPNCFVGVPIFYWPYIRFPLTEERLTGFLFPSIGVSNKTGTDLRVPFYWNIAPSMDMTITPRFMSIAKMVRVT